MNQAGRRVVRPTLRCLLEDLAPDIGPEAFRVAIRTAAADLARDPTHLLPGELFDVEHPIIDKANHLIAGEGSEMQRIQAITDRHAIKVKTGDLRGAVWEDPSGTWWLLAVGNRRVFYDRLDRFTGAASAAIAPTEIDTRYLSLERAYVAELESERSTHGLVLEAVFLAARAPGEEIEVEAFGAILSVRVDPDEAGLAVLSMSWEFAKFDEMDRFPYDVLAMVPGLANMDDWDYLPPIDSKDSPYTWFTYVPWEWVEHLATSVEIDDLIGSEGWTPVNPCTDGSEHFSHYAQSSIVTLAYVRGIEIEGLCGARVVAHRDYERFPTCPRCVENLELLRQVRADTRP